MQGIKLRLYIPDHNHVSRHWVKLFQKRIKISQIVFIDYFDLKSKEVHQKHRKFDINCSIGFTYKGKYINYEKVTKFTRDYATYQTFEPQLPSFKVIGMNKKIFNFK
jgi:hypothetical protein